MKSSQDNIKLIFGLKLRQFRTEKKISQSELSDKSGIAVSYLNEIEKGKKYPKADKIMALAEALNVPYDKLVSLKLTGSLKPVGDLLQSNILNDLPLDLFGINLSRIIEMIAQAPTRVNAFITTLIEIARNYDMQQEHFYFAALRSFQEIQDNFFEDIEAAVDSFVEEYELETAPPFDPKNLEQVLIENGFEMDNDGLSTFENLNSFRSLLIPGKVNRLLINKDLSKTQRAFVLAREIGFHFLGIKERPYTFSWLKVKSFEQVLNNFRASYFASALLINRKSLNEDLSSFFAQPKWSGKDFLTIMKKYNASPEMFLHRLTSIAPKDFGLKGLFFLRFSNHNASDKFALTKELHLSRQHNPHANETREHYCRRWISLTILEDLNKKLGQKKVPNAIVGAQISKYIDSPNQYFVISIARPMLPTPDTTSSVSIGFLMSNEFKKKVAFWNDPKVKVREVNDTCERCPANDCAERVAPPSVLEKRKKQEQLQQSINALANSSQRFSKTNT